MSDRNVAPIALRDLVESINAQVGRVKNVRYLAESDLGRTKTPGGRRTQAFMS
jgi:hypothetical protein